MLQEIDNVGASKGIITGGSFKKRLEVLRRHKKNDWPVEIPETPKGLLKGANLSGVGFKSSTTFISDARKFISKPKNLTSAQVKPIKIQEKSVTDILNKAQI